MITTMYNISSDLFKKLLGSMALLFCCNLVNNSPPGIGQFEPANHPDI